MKAGPTFLIFLDSTTLGHVITLCWGVGGWGEGQIPGSGACNTQYPWIQLTVQPGSQERVSEGDRAGVFTRAMSMHCVRAYREITKLKQ